MRSPMKLLDGVPRFDIRAYRPFSQRPLRRGGDGKTFVGSITREAGGGGVPVHRSSTYLCRWGGGVQGLIRW
jgi:hypothetical protein